MMMWLRFGLLCLSILICLSLHTVNGNVARRPETRTEHKEVTKESTTIVSSHLDLSTTKVQRNFLSLFWDIFEENSKSESKDLSGEEMARLMTIGTKVVRGKDWQEYYGEVDGSPSGEGKVVAEINQPFRNSGAREGWLHVEWDTGIEGAFRMGAYGKYDLKLAQ